MNKQDRGVIKWAPFNSLVDQKEMLKKLIKEKEKISKPKLSEEQIEQNEKLLVEAFFEKSKVKIEYFKNGFILSTTANINHIDYTFKKIYLNNQKVLLFSQIMKINML